MYLIKDLEFPEFLTRSGEILFIGVRIRRAPPSYSANSSTLSIG